jgi:hypothetical protein
MTGDLQLVYVAILGAALAGMCLSTARGQKSSTGVRNAMVRLMTAFPGAWR